MSIKRNERARLEKKSKTRRGWISATKKSKKRGEDDDSENVTSTQGEIRTKEGINRVEKKTRTESRYSSPPVKLASLMKGKPPNQEKGLWKKENHRSRKEKVRNSLSRDAEAYQEQLLPEREYSLVRTNCGG